MVLFQNCLRQSHSPTKMATTLLLKAALIQVSDYMHLGASGCNLQSRTQTHAILVIGLYEFLGNPTTWLIEPPRLFTYIEYFVNNRWLV